MVFSAAMLHRARSVIARLARRPGTDELDERLYQITRDVTFFRSLVMAPLVARLASGSKRRPAPADAFAQIAGMPFVTAAASRPVARAAARRDR